MREAWLVLILAASALAGCSVPELAAPYAGGAEPEPGPLSEPDAAKEAGSARFILAPASAPALATPLPVAVELSQRWLKPFGRFDVGSDAPADASLAWFVEHEDVEPRATVVNGDVYVLKSTTPDSRAPDLRRSRADIDDLAADGRSRGLRVEIPGRYALAAGEARLVLNVWPDAPLDVPSQAFLVDDGDGNLRFEPPEVDMATGGRLALWSQVARPMDVREVGFAAYVPLGAKGGQVTPIDEGLYHVVLVARDAGGARGVAREPFLVDFERPSERLSVGPATGRFLLAADAVEEPHRIAFGAQHPLRSLIVRLHATSASPTAASVEVSLVRAGETLATASTLTAGEMAFEELPAGGYALVVRAEHGVSVAYEVSASGLYALPTPERLRAAMT